MATTVSQPGYFNLQGFTDLGALAVGGRIYTYTQGTTTKKNAYTEATGTTVHTYASDGVGGEYIALNARGELPAPLYLTTGAYDITYKTAAGATVWTRRADPIGDAGTFTAAAAGSVATTTQTKLRNIIGVLDEGDTDNVGTLTLAVPSVYSTIQAAMDYLNAHTIAAGTTVKIQVADGTYNLSANLNMNHPQGSQIQLVGNETTPASVVLSVAGSGFDCLTVSDGNKLGYLNGFKFYKTVKALAADNTTAILANNGATIICGDDIVVDNWYYGIAARNGSTIECDYAQVDHSGDVGIWAFCGSFVQCRNAVSNNAIDVANDLGFGIQAEYGSTVDCQSASATGCRKAGIAALSNSHVRSLSSTTSTNTGSGLLARDGGTIEAHGATSSSNTRYGIESIADGHVYYSSITASGNTIGNFAPKAYFDNTTALGARIVSDDGDFRIDSSGAYNIYFNTSGGAQFGVIHVASAVNRLQVKGSATGSGPILEAFGTDAVIDIQILPKGVGSYVKLGAGFTGTADVACNGYIPIKDDGGTIRKLMTTA